MGVPRAIHGIIIMNRREFTKNIATLLLEMVYADEQPIIDYVLRSTEEQKRLFDSGLSKCDGVNRKSSHQSALAADIYLVTTRPDGTQRIDFEWDLAKAVKWHDKWVQMGGRPMIDWDLCHFDGKDYDETH